MLAVDFYRNLEARPEGDPGAFIRGLFDDQVLEDVARGVAFFGERPETAGARVGVTGVCMGGMYAMLAACRVSGLAAAAPFYGMLSYEHGLVAGEGERDRARKPTSPLEATAGLGCPLLAFFGEDDDFVPVADVRALSASLAATEHSVEVVIYPEAGHAFMNETRPEAHRPQAAEDAWARLAAFFDRHLVAG